MSYSLIHRFPFEAAYIRSDVFWSCCTKFEYAAVVVSILKPDVHTLSVFGGVAVGCDDT
jgi:hypothetical protein